MSLFGGLTSTLSNVSGVDIPAPPLDIPLPVDLELVDKDGNIKVAGQALPLDLNSITGLLQNLSIEGLKNFVKNLSWEYVKTLAKQFADQAYVQLQAYVDKYLEPYKKYFRENKVLIIYAAICIAILLIPIIFFIIFVFVAFGFGFVLFLVLFGIVVFAAGILLVGTLIGLIVVLAVIGIVVFGVDWVLKKFNGWVGSDKEEKGEGEKGEKGDAGKNEREKDAATKKNS